MLIYSIHRHICPRELIGVNDILASFQFANSSLSLTIEFVLHSITTLYFRHEYSVADYFIQTNVEFRVSLKKQIRGG